MYIHQLPGSPAAQPACPAVQSAVDTASPPVSRGDGAGSNYFQDFQVDFKLFQISLQFFKFFKIFKIWSLPRIQLHSSPAAH